MRASFQTLFFKSYILCFVVSLVALLMLDYGEAVILINSSRNALLDQSMPWLTLLGDGFFYGGVALVLIFYKWRLGVFFAFSGVLQALVSAVLKRVVFGKLPRPTKYFEEQGVALELIPGVDNASVFTFPSGHTMTVFMLSGLLAFTIVPRRYHLLLLFAALLGGFSRIYLLQHFLQDVVAGSLVGVFMAAILAATLYPRLVLEK
jgi:membrane-associated phospholipid phosphatase